MIKESLQPISGYIDMKGYVSSEELCRVFDVSVSTMRRYLIELDKRGLIQRVRGGASSLAHLQTEEAPFSAKRSLETAEKKRIASHAFSLIRDGDTILLDSSSSVYELAVLIAESPLKLTVITNDISISALLANCSDINLIQIGGYVRRGYYTTLGVFAEQILGQIHAKKLFLGCDAVNPALGIMTHRIEEIPAKRLMTEASENIIVLCDHTKFHSSAAMQVCSMELVDYVITDTGVSEDVLDSFGDYRSKIVTV